MFFRIRSLPVARDRQHGVLEVLAEAKDHGPASDEVRVQHQAERFQPVNSNVRQDQQVRGDHSIYEQFGIMKAVRIYRRARYRLDEFSSHNCPPMIITTTIIGAPSLRF